MELKPGYKQTEVGVIPEDWDVCYLEEIVRSDAPVCYGILMPGPNTPNGIPVVKVKDIIGGQIDVSGLHLTHPDIDRAYKRSRLSAGDLLITIRGSTGHIAIVPKNLEGANITQDTARACLDRSTETRCVFFALQESNVQQQVELNTISQVVKGINIRDAKKLKLCMPPRQEQRLIADALTNVDNLINSLGHLFQKKQAIKQAAMQELLTGKRRLPGFEGEWEGARLGELFKFSNGLNKAKEFFGKGTPIVNYMDVFNNSAIYVSTLRGRVLLTKQERQVFDVCKGDVFFTRTSETREDIGVASVVLSEVADTAFSGFLLRARPINNRLEHGFKAYCFQSEKVRAQIVSKASRTTRALTNGKILSEVKMLVPPLPEQLAIAHVLADMDAELSALEEQLCKARELKQGMMQQLLTGKIRLK